MKPPGTPQRLRYPLSEAAVLLGLHIDTLRKRIEDGEITTVRDGKRIFILNEELLRYAQQGVKLKAS